MKLPARQMIYLGVCLPVPDSHPSSETPENRSQSVQITESPDSDSDCSADSDIALPSSTDSSSSSISRFLCSSIDLSAHFSRSDFHTFHFSVSSASAHAPSIPPQHKFRILEFQLERAAPIAQFQSQSQGPPVSSSSAQAERWQSEFTRVASSDPSLVGFSVQPDSVHDPSISSSSSSSSSVSSFPPFVCLLSDYCFDYLRLVDDDKKAKRSQQFLTDLFSRVKIQ